MHTIKFTYDDIPVVVTQSAKGLQTIKVGKLIMLGYRWQWRIVLENIQTMALDALDTRGGCPECGRDAFDGRDCHECGYYTH